MRKDIWKYFQENYEAHLYTYQTFLGAINQLIREEKINKNDNGYIQIIPEVYKELYQDCAQKKSAGKLNDNHTGKNSVAKKSAGRLSAVCKSKQNYLQTSRTYGPSVSVSNGKNCLGKIDIPTPI